MSIVKIFEMGPRDGLQNEIREVTLAQKTLLIKGLVKAGLKEIEVGAFVRPDRVPQMANSDEVFKKVKSSVKNAWVLVPNEQGLERALAVGATRLGFFTAVSNTFNEKNIGKKFNHSMEEIVSLVKKAPLKGRIYLSTAFGCPFEGWIKANKTLKAIEKIWDKTDWSISLGDTIGVARPKEVENVIFPLKKIYGEKWIREKLAVHFHDTRGTALSNALKAYELGVVQFDSSAGGLGGCPFAPGATGNLATEDLVYLFNGLGVKTGVSLEKLCDASIEFEKVTGIAMKSRYLHAFQAAKKSNHKPYCFI